MSNYLTGLAQLNPQVKRHNGGTTTLTLDQNGTTNATLLFVNGVAQSPGTDFNVSGTTLTATSTLPAGTNICTTIQYFNTGIVNTVADDAITSAKIADNAIGLAQMASGTDGNIISYDASGNPVAVATGNDGQVLTSAGAGAPPVFETLSAGFTLATEQATTSGTSKTFTGIPAGTKIIIVMLEGVSCTPSAWECFVQLGDSGGIETSGYAGVHMTLDASDESLDPANLSTGFRLHDTTVTAAADYLHGHLILALKDSSNYTWTGNGVFSQNNADMVIVAANKSLSAELTQVTVIGTTAFDAGSVNIMYQ